MIASHSCFAYELLCKRRIRIQEWEGSIENGRNERILA